MTDSKFSPILQAELDEAMAGLKNFRHGVAYKSVGSTNDEALRLEKTSQEQGYVVTTEHQTKGRGRLARSWLMSDGDLVMSIIVRPPLIPAKISLLSLIPAVAIAEGLSSLGVNIRCKWPNDLLIEDAVSLDYFLNFRKVGGILVENVFVDAKLSASIIGIGLNIVSHESDREAVPHIGSLAQLPLALNRKRCLSEILRSLDALFSSVTKPDFAKDLIAAYATRCETLGRKVAVETDGAHFVGHAERLNEDGYLVVDGQTIRAGDVVFARTSP